MSISVTALSEEDWQTLRDIRLRALRNDPGVFSSNHADESAYGENKWRAMLKEDNVQIFALFDKDQPIGMTGVAIDRYDSSAQRAVLWGSWVEPAYRQRGLSTLLYEARIDWAQRHPTCTTIVVSHRASNTGSKRANQKHGFIFTHAVSKVWPDGGTDDDMFYERSVKPKGFVPSAPRCV